MCFKNFVAYYLMWYRNVIFHIDDYYTKYVFAHKGTQELYETQIYNCISVFDGWKGVI